MRTIERYIFREVLQSWLGVTLVLLVILLSNQLATVLGKAASSGFSGNVVLWLLWLTSIQQLLILIPIGLFLGVMLALGRLYHESELTAMQACGLSNRQLLRPVLWLAALAAAILAWLAFDLAPTSTQQALDLRSQATREARFASLQPGKFRSFGGNRNIVFYAESVDADGVLHNVYAERSLGDRLEIWTAQRAIQQGIGEQEQTFILYDGERYEGAPGSGEFRIIEFAEGGIPVSLPDIAAGKSDVDMQPTLSLLGMHTPAAVAELHQRLAYPVMALVLAVIAVPLARLRPRQGRYAKVGIFIVVYLLYFALTLVADNLLLRGQASAALGMWWVHALMVALAGWLWRHDVIGLLRRHGAMTVEGRA